jgi:outer membrane cobalamin receptor
MCNRTEVDLHRRPCDDAGMNRRSDGLASSVARTVLPLLAIAAIVLGTGCRSGPPTSGAAPVSGHVTVITQDEIVAMGARSAWDAVRARAPYFFASTESAGRPTDLRIQAPSSANADETPLVVVDGVQAMDLSWLTQIPAADIASIHVLDAGAAEPIYGLRAAGGAIVIVTRTR